MLADNPHVLKKLRQEVLDTVGPTDRPTYDDIKNMKYMRAVINGMPFSRLFFTWDSRINQRFYDYTLQCQ